MPIQSDKSIVKFEKIAASLEFRLTKIVSFKIGKTGQTIEERYREAYLQKFKNISRLYASNRKAEIDDLEAFLIRRFLTDSRCKNEQIDGGEMTVSDTNTIYLVYN